MREWEHAAWWIQLPQSVRDKLDTYYDLMMEWNERINLTSIVHPQEAYVKHFADSLSVRQLREWSALPLSARVVDVGTGAGLPGIPLALAEPQRTFVLVDSLRKRLGFLETVAEALNLANVSFVHARAEDAARRPELRDSFGCVVARAVAKLPVLAELTLPFLAPQGLLFAYKGPTAVAEVVASRGAVERLGGTIGRWVDYDLPDGCGRRLLIVVHKDTKTPPRFPRRAGVPQRDPLL